MISADARALFRELVDRSEHLLLTTHMNPDGDALGSQLGLAAFLQDRGKRIEVVNQDPSPPNLRFVEEGCAPIEIWDEKRHADLMARVDLIVLLDNSAPDRLGRMERPMCDAADRVLCVDHHPTRVTPWRHNVLDVDACATASMVVDLTRELGWRPGPAAARALFVGLATDTGFFRFNSTTPRAFEIAAELMGAGVEPARCYELIYERNSEAYTRLLGQALVGLRTAASGAVAAVTLTHEQVVRSGADAEDTSEMTTVLLAMHGVQVAILLRELEGGRVKVSLRSKGRLDVRRLATEFGGGGHRNASGIVLKGSLEDAATRVIARAEALAGDE